MESKVSGSSYILTPILPLSAPMDFHNSRASCGWLGLGGPRGQAWLGLFWMPFPHSPQEQVLKFSLFFSDLGFHPHPQMLRPSVTETTGAITFCLCTSKSLSFLFSCAFCPCSPPGSTQGSTPTSAWDAARLDPNNSSCLCQSSFSTGFSSTTSKHTHSFLI